MTGREMTDARLIDGRDNASLPGEGESKQHLIERKLNTSREELLMLDKLATIIVPLTAKKTKSEQQLAKKEA